MTEFWKNIFLFLYAAFIISLVWSCLNQQGARRILREGLRTFAIFVTGAFVLAAIMYALS